MLFVRHRLHGQARTAALAISLLLYFIGVLAMIVAISASERAERRAGAIAGKVWRSGFTRVFFRLAGLRMRPEDREAPAAPDGSRMELPDEVRRELPELPALLERYDAVLHGLRRREEQVERALAEAGPTPQLPEPIDVGDSGGTGVTTRAVLLHRRLSLVGELRSSLETLRARRTDVIAAHENVRIQLARLRAGVASPPDLREDVSTLRATLDDAQV
jgi:hypothetical protein